MVLFNRSPFGEPRAAEDRSSLLGEKSHAKFSRSKSNDPCSQSAVSSKSETELCANCQSVQRANSWNDTTAVVTINDVNFENVVDYYKVSATTRGSDDEYVCAEFTGNRRLVVEKSDEELCEHTDESAEFAQSVASGSGHERERGGIGDKLRINDEEVLVKGERAARCCGASYAADAVNPLRLGSAEFEFTDGPSTRIYRFPSTGIGLDRSVFDMTVYGPRSAASLLAKHWGPRREVTVRRDSNGSLGISIVGGKVICRRVFFSLFFLLNF